MTDRLIWSLVEDLTPVQPRSYRQDIVLLGLVGFGELLLVILCGPMRADLATAVMLPTFWWKLVSLAVISLLGAITTLRSLNPARSSRLGLGAIAATTAITLLVGWMIDAVERPELPVLSRLDWHRGVHCAGSMMILAVPPLIALWILQRRSAPTQRWRTALAAGATAAAWGALAFVFICVHDDPLYIVIWYLIACGIVTFLATVVYSATTRW